MGFSNKNINRDDFKPIYLDGKEIDYDTLIWYLGTAITSSPGFVFSAIDDLLNFYHSANSTCFIGFGLKNRFHNISNFLNLDYFEKIKISLIIIIFSK